ncbi:hypothetical protein BBO99_00003965 [Phytophthora kernoviae]|uniref:Uncharacterized protein n=2 Tax=Phytophthora kernoviae TaxID=325452 RepID=A0A3R7G479_9STRA|nr:hypothetical protein G195_004480 [Phytophthora kernoviae 00238/432]KAG2526427.1 hypothetical protein JM16_003824 [Phytophthora kernoviae]KAG2528054.1 hypothetical protein JM18_003404 [Phytophthora kernoviae]RLN31979.1 hypothetical protein BBI17_004024 [Phytophthora kernoviae]RLN81111.1 hypothetical protein BBO99_00003965 [Phytophthora kernoviae]
MADARALDDDELDAHRQVLGMASAIEQLTQDFARQQVELAAAYKRLQQYTLQEESGDSPKVRQSVRPGNRRETSSALLGCPGAIDVPHDERFDVESTYKQRKQTGDTFWRQQYKEAVRMRKSPGQQGVVTTQYNSGGIGTPQPSLKIFSCPDNRKKINQIRDESVPFSRYIGISSKQNEIIKEQHRMLEKE